MSKAKASKAAKKERTPALTYEQRKAKGLCVKCPRKVTEKDAVVCVFCSELAHYWREHKKAGTKYPGVEAFARTAAGKAAEEGKRTHTAPKEKA